MQHTEYQPRRYRGSWRLPLALAGIVATLALFVALVGTIRSVVDPIARQQQRLELMRQEQLAENLGGIDTLVAAGWRLLPLLLVASAGVVGLLVVYRRWAVPAMIKADKVIALQHAQSQRFPAQLHSLSFHDSSRPIIAPAALPQLEAPEDDDTESTPTFADLLANGRIGKGNPLVLGFNAEDGKELAGTWLDLYSTAVAGMPGTGKTTTQRFLACQTALQGAKFAVIDPHMGASDDSLASTLAPLTTAFVCEPASTDKAILDVVRYVADVGKRRVTGKDNDTTPLILWADELTSLLSRSSIADDLAELLEKIAQEYRKRFVFVCGSGQIWTASRTTSELRDSFASVLCHRMKRGQARLLLPTDEASQVERLATGSAVLWRTSGETMTIAIPNTTPADVRRVAGMLTDNQPTMPRVSAIPSAIPSARNQPGISHAYAAGDSASQSVKTLSPENMRIVALFLEGKDAGAIVADVFGLSSKGGQPYMRKLSEVQAVIREAMREIAIR